MKKALIIFLSLLLIICVGMFVVSQKSNEEALPKIAQLSTLSPTSTPVATIKLKDIIVGKWMAVDVDDDYIYALQFKKDGKFDAWKHRGFNKESKKWPWSGAPGSVTTKLAWDFVTKGKHTKGTYTFNDNIVKVKFSNGKTQNYKYNSEIYMIIDGDIEYCLND